MSQNDQTLFKSLAAMVKETAGNANPPFLSAR